MLDVPQPRIRVLPIAERTTDHGERAAKIAVSSGIGLDEWQQGVLTDMLAEKDNGTNWHAPVFGLCVARQAGKSQILMARMLYGAVRMKEAILYTSHEVKSARAIFTRLVEIFEASPELMKRTRNIRKANGTEGIYLKNGGSIEFSTRTPRTGRGRSHPVLIIDEAMETDEDSLSALLPVISSFKRNQVIWAGTAPSPTMNSEVFTRLRNNALEGSDGRLCWVEFSAPQDADLDDVQMWHLANPSLGIRVSLDTIAGERATMSDDDFARERLGIWTNTVATRGVIPSELWAACADPDSEPEHSLVLGVDVSPSRTNTSIAVAGYRSDGRIHTEVVESRPGVGWAAGRLVKIAERQGIRTIVLDGASPAATLVNEIRALTRKIRIKTTSAKEIVVATGSFYDAITEQTLTHLDDPATNFAISQAGKRNLVGAWTWNRLTATSDITPVLALTLAFYGVKDPDVRKRKLTAPTEGAEPKKRAILVL